MNNWDELKKAAEYAQDFDNFADEAEEMRALSKFYDEVDPDQVLALIAENERLREESHKNRMDFVDEVEKRDQLRAEVDALRKDAERYRWARDCGNSSYLYAMICAGQCGHNMDDAIDEAAKVLRKDLSNG